MEPWRCRIPYRFGEAYEHEDIAGIKKALSQKISVPADEIPFSQEVIAHDGESQEFAPGQYVRNGQVTEFRFAAQLRTAFSGSISGLKNIESGKLPSDKATVFVANWDTERNGESLNPESGAVYELANASCSGTAMAARRSCRTTTSTIPPPARRQRARPPHARPIRIWTRHAPHPRPRRNGRGVIGSASRVDLHAWHGALPQCHRRAESNQLAEQRLERDCLRS